MVANTNRTALLVLFMSGSFLTFWLLLPRYDSPYLFSFSSYEPLTSSTTTCDPYEQLGFLDMPQELAQHQWRAYDEECQTPALFPSFIRSAFNQSNSKALTENDLLRQVKASEWIANPQDPFQRRWENVDWARGRTILFQGDSVGRFQTRWFCEMAGGEFDGIGPWHPWWPYVEWVTANGQKHTKENLQKRKDMSYHDPHYCWIPSMDFLIIQLHTFGLDEVDFWLHADQNLVGEGTVLGPYKYEQRFEYLGLEIIKAANTHLGRKQDIDMALLISTLWDHDKILKDLAREGTPYVENLPSETLYAFKRRVRQASEWIMNRLPGTPIRWQSVHYPMMNPYPEGKTPHNLNHLVPMSQAIKQVVRDLKREGYPIGNMPWGDAMMGTERFLIDRVHPGPFPNIPVWGDMLLFYLRQAVLHHS